MNLTILNAHQMLDRVRAMADLLRDNTEAAAVTGIEAMSEPELRALLAAIAGLTQMILPALDLLARSELERRGLPPSAFVVTNLIPEKGAT